MLQFYKLKEKMQTLSAQLSWSHYVELLHIDDPSKINYYIKSTELNNWSVRKLRDKVRSNEYIRLPEDTKNKIINNRELIVTDFVKNPIKIKNNYNGNLKNAKSIEKVLKGVGYDVEFENGVYHVTVPVWRSTGDVSLKDDVMGDIARLLSFALCFEVIIISPFNPYI